MLKGRDGVVRCFACACEYELPQRADEARGCPKCGDPAWIVVVLAPSPRKVPLQLAV